MEILTLFIDIFDVEVISEFGFTFKNKFYEQGKTFSMTDNEYRLLNSVIPNLYDLIRVMV